MLSENKKEFPPPFVFRPTGGCGPSLRSLPTPLVFSAGPLLLLRLRPSLAQIADPPDPAHQPPWPCASPRGAHPGPDPQLLQCPWRTRLAPPPTFSSASVPCTPCQQRLHRPIKAKRSSLARPALRFTVPCVLPRSPAPTKPPPPAVLDPPAMEPLEPTEDVVKLATLLRTFAAPPWRQEVIGAPPPPGTSWPLLYLRRRPLLFEFRPPLHVPAVGERSHEFPLCLSTCSTPHPSRKPPGAPAIWSRLVPLFAGQR
jgi:hypothetical protein